MRHILHVIAITATTAASQSCGSEPQVLFQSNAYIDCGAYQGGSILETQKEWDSFTNAFQPNNYGESLARTSVDFSTEKVVVGSYFAFSTCHVEISDARLECATDAAVQMKMVLDIVDASIGCDLKCGALGQVVYAVAVPSSWQIDEIAGFQIDVTGPCVAGGLSASSDTVPTSSPDQIMLNETATGATVVTTADELNTSFAVADSVFSAATAQQQIISLDTETDPNEPASTTTLQSTQPSTISTTEAAVIGQSQLHGMVSTHDMIVDNVTMMPVGDSSETTNETFSIDKDAQTTTTPAPNTDSQTTTIRGESDLAAVMASKSASDLDNTSSTMQRSVFVCFILLTFSAVYFV